ncbi:MAG: hypothetical protein R3D52_02265 [Xanthobacteraceae bacterium]
MFFKQLKLAADKAKYFNSSIENNITTISLNYPERKEPRGTSSSA